MFKIEVFNALHTRFGPSKYTSLKTTLHNTTPRLKMKTLSLTWSPRYDLLVTRTNKRRALSPQEVKLDGWFLTLLHIVLETCTISFMHKLNMSFVFHFYNLGLIDVLDLNRPLQLKTWNLRALQNETHMRASFLNTGHMLWWSFGLSFIDLKCIPFVPLERWVDFLPFIGRDCPSTIFVLSDFYVTYYRPLSDGYSWWLATWQS